LPTPTDEVRRLGMATDVETAGSILRIGRTTANKLIGEGDFPVPVLRVGKRYVVAVENVLTLVGSSGRATTFGRDWCGRHIAVDAFCRVRDGPLTDSADVRTMIACRPS